MTSSYASALTWVKVQNFKNIQIIKLAVCILKINNFKFKWSPVIKLVIISLIQYFEADFLWKVSLKILNSGIILKEFTHALIAYFKRYLAGRVGVTESANDAQTSQ